MKPLIILTVLGFYLSAGSLSLVAADPSEPVTLFVVGETEGQLAVLAKNGKPLPKAAFSEDKTSDAQIVQMTKGEDKKAKYLLVTNTGSSEVSAVFVGNAMVFTSVSNAMHSTLTICLDREYPDGSYLAIETLVRPDAFGSGATLARVFHGKARPSPFLAAELKPQKTK